MVRFWRVGLALCPTSHPRLKWPLVRMRHRGGNVLRDQAFYERLRASPLNPMESGLIIFHGPSREISDKEVTVRMPVFLEHDASCGLTRISDALTSYIRCSFGPKRLKIQRLQTRNRPSCNRPPKIEFDSYIRCSLAPKYSYIGCSYFVHQMRFSAYHLD